MPPLDMVYCHSWRHFFYYNQISMYLPDLDKIAIIIPQGLYYYNVMLFGLKSVKATYQWIVIKIF